MKLSLKRGLNLNIEGGIPANCQPSSFDATVCAIIPDDFAGFMPKVAAREGDFVAVGTPLLLSLIHIRR
ncbi:MAG: hypothetical protein K2F63_05210 [Muribaculaceae bacterium]|nr:hypothetical protein [Muribaculaceae bacterium]